MKRVLITGASGFVGANLARRLLLDGHTIRLALRTESRLWRIREIVSHVEVSFVDLGDAEAVHSLISAFRPEWVFHLAAHGAYPEQRDARCILLTNALGAVNLLDACTQVGCGAFVQTGSSSEYGFKDHAPAETEPIEPNSLYAVSKAAATHYGNYVARTRGLKVTTLRLYSVYGPYEEPTRLMPALIDHGLRGRFPPLVDPKTARDFIYIDDVLDACIQAATVDVSQPGAVFNVGTGIQTSLREVVEVARRIFKISDNPIWGSMPDRHWDTYCWVADITNARRELGWQPRTAFETGLRRMIEWYRANPALLPSARSRACLAA